MLNILPIDLLIYLEDFIYVKDLLSLRSSSKMLNIHEYEYYKKLFFLEIKKEIIKRFLLIVIMKYKVKKIFFKRVLNDIEFRKKYFKVHKFPLHVCTYNHKLTPYLNRFFTSVQDIRIQLVNKIKNQEIIEYLNNTEIVNYEIIKSSFENFVNQ